MKYKILFLVLSIFLLLFLSGCTKAISDVKSDEHVDDRIIVRGEVKGSLKLGDLSGYMIEDKSGSIFVSSDSLPKEGSKIFARGILKKNILGYYIDAKD